MLNADPPRHTRLRKLVGRAFLPRQLEPRRARIQEIADDLIDAFPESGEIDLMDFALSLPMRMICELLGVPIEVRPRLHTWGSIISGAPYLDEESNKRLRLAIEGIDGFLRDLLKARREVPGDDLISQMLEVAHEGQEYTDDEVVATLVLLLIAGHRTTASLIGNGMRALFLHPDQLAMLSADPGLAPSAVEELLRYGSPLYRSTLRIATEDIELHGVTIGKGSFVHLMIDSANHDPAAFADPDRLDITRESTHHLSFGQGPHFCAGAPLSRIEGQVAFGTLFRRLQGLRLAVPAGQLTWIAGHSPTRTLEKLPVRYDRRLPR
jgi:cytochrome P450